MDKYFLIYLSNLSNEAGFAAQFGGDMRPLRAAERTTIIKNRERIDIANESRVSNQKPKKCATQKYATFHILLILCAFRQRAGLLVRERSWVRSPLAAQFSPYFQYVIHGGKFRVAYRRRMLLANACCAPLRGAAWRSGYCPRLQPLSDLIHHPADARASTANCLAGHGCKRGQGWDENEPNFEALLAC